MELVSLVDRALSGPNSRLDRLSAASQAAVRAAAETRIGRPVTVLLRGNETLGGVRRETAVGAALNSTPSCSTWAPGPPAHGEGDLSGAASPRWA